MNATNSSKICRICCNQRVDDLISLLDAENKAIVKKLRACADVTFEHDDLLPKYICEKCLQKLNLAYNFKIQCEFMDQRLRKTIGNSLQKQIDLPTTVNSIESSSYFDSDEENSFVCSSEQFTMDDVDTIIEECVEEEQSMEEVVYLEQNVNCDQVGIVNQFVVPSNQQQFEEPKHDIESNVMEISQKTAEIDQFDSLGSLPSAKEAEECVDQDMFSVKSENSSSPKVKAPFKCDTCNATFYIHSEYIRHTKVHGKNRYQCVICSKWFAKRYLLNAHQKTHNGTKNYECALCQKRYTSQSNLDRHIRAFHRQERQHKCITCHKTFSQLSGLRLHQSVHIAEREFSCDICGNKFKTEVQLKLHIKRHLPTEYRRPRRKYTPPKKPYKSPPKFCLCNECGKRFTSIALLRSHMQSHSLEKKYECNICKKRFSFQQSLRNHIFLHTGEKRFKCDICHLSFRQIGHLQGHKLVHTGIKPHSCSTCGKAFALRGNLTVHMRTHSTSATSYESKESSNSSGLKQHHLMPSLLHQRETEENAAIEQILNAPITEASSLSEIPNFEQQVFKNVSTFNVNHTDALRFYPTPDVVDGNSLLIFK